MTEFLSLLISYSLGDLCASSFAHFHPVLSFSFFSLLLSLPRTERRLFLPRVALLCLSAHFPNMSWNTHARMRTHAHAHTHAELQGRWGKPASWKNNQKERDGYRCAGLVWLSSSCVVRRCFVLSIGFRSLVRMASFFSGHQCVIMNSDRPSPLLVKEDKKMEIKWRKRWRKLMVESKTDGLKEKKVQKKLEWIIRLVLDGRKMRA